jgi:hypothetical protein
MISSFFVSDTSATSLPRLLGNSFVINCCESVLHASLSRVSPLMPGNLSNGLFQMSFLSGKLRAIATDLAKRLRSLKFAFRRRPVGPPGVVRPPADGMTDALQPSDRAVARAMKATAKRLYRLPTSEMAIPPHAQNCRSVSVARVRTGWPARSQCSLGDLRAGRPVKSAKAGTMPNHLN